MSTVIIQARMGSKRLPGKSMADLGGVPVIDWAVERAALAQTTKRVIVATSTNKEDDHLADNVSRQGIAVVYRGDSQDVLARYAGALAHTDDDVIVRITGDCPFAQPELIDLAVDALDDLAYVASGPDGRFPRGFDVEVIDRSALERANAEAIDPVEREHVTPFIVRRPDEFPTGPFECPAWARHPDLRLTLDEPSDLDLLRAVVAELDASPKVLDGRAVIDLLSKRPDLTALNSGVAHNIII